MNQETLEKHVYVILTSKAFKTNKACFGGSDYDSFKFWKKDLQEVSKEIVETIINVES